VPDEADIVRHIYDLYTRKKLGIEAIAAALGIEDGDMIKVISRRGEVTAKARVTDTAPPGTIAMTFHFAETPTNEITSPALDPISKIPEYKVVAVRVEKAGKIPVGAD
jgi:formate dehydrogenase major subunit